MARRPRSTGLAEDILNLVAKLPWWGGVLLGLLAYLVLHAVAERPLPMATKPGEFGAMAGGMMWRALAGIGQYLLPALCFIAALVSFLRRQRRAELVATAIRADTTTEALHGISWQDFERLVGEGFRRLGYQVVETGQAGPDGGVDLELRKQGELHLVQCKQWRAQRVGVEVVRALYGVMAARGAASGIVVSAGKFTNEASRFAEGRNLRLITGDELHDLLRELTPLSTTQRTVASAPPPAFASAHSCPQCSGSMVPRIAKRGNQAGQRFWGCAAYPTCRGTRPWVAD